MPLPKVRNAFEFGASRVLGPLGYELRDKVLSERPEGFPGYLAAAREAAMDVNDFEEQRLGWRLPRPTLDEIAYPYLRPDSTVCEIGPGTGRWSRHILSEIPRGELHLVDPSPWMVRFLTGYFAPAGNVHAHLNDGQSLPFERHGWLDLIFSANTFVELKLGVIWLYARDFVRALKPGGYAVVDYVDPTTLEGWEHLMTQPVDLASVYTFHAPDVIDSVFEQAGLTIERRYQVGKSTFVVAQNVPEARLGGAEPGCEPKREPEVTFFMIVTPRDAVIADYAVRSYARIKDVDFSLVVYSNYLLPAQKAYYFPRWETFPFVHIARNPHHDADLSGINSRIKSDALEGPFEYCDPLWDRELRQIQTPLIATVDADFEILRPNFLAHILRRLRAESDLVGFSTDYSPTAVVHEPYNGNTIVLNERNHTWFCIYKQTAFERSQVSQAFYREMLPNAPVERNCWDSCAYFQKSLRDQGLRFDYLHGQFRRDFIHYGAFSKNTTVTRETVALFRLLAILENNLPGRVARLVRRARSLVLPRLENNRYQYVREAPIRW